MTIIHVITAFGIGGAEKLLLNTVNQQVKKHEVHLIHLKSLNDLVCRLDINVIVSHIPLSLLTVRNLQNYYKKHTPDVIHTHLSHADFLGIWSARKTKAKVFCTMHNIYFKQNILDAVFFKVYRFLFHRIVKGAHMISISKSVENHVLSKLKIRKNRSHLLYNAIPLIEASTKTDSEVVRLLFVGRLEKQKSVLTLLKAIRKVKDSGVQREFKLLVVGDGKQRQDLLKQTESLRIKELVIFTGKKEDTLPYFENSDIFILPSIWEGFGIVILEAFRSKLAVIASNIEGPAELIIDQKNGLLFPPENDDELKNAIVTLIHDEEKRLSLADNGYKAFTRMYQIDRYVEELEKIYKNA